MPKEIVFGSGQTYPELEAIGREVGLELVVLEEGRMSGVAHLYYAYDWEDQ